MDGVEKELEQSASRKKEETNSLQSCDTMLPETSLSNNERQGLLHHLDSFEQMEAKIMSHKPLDDEDVADPSSSTDKSERYFCEDYSIKDGTFLDTGELTEQRTFDIIKDLETLERLRHLEMENQEDLQREEKEMGNQHASDATSKPVSKKTEDNEETPLDLETDEDLERKELAALIKKAEEKLLPTEKYVQDSLETIIDDTGNVFETATESQVGELEKLDKCVPLQDLVRMESSDLSEEEGFRQRLSCIFEESESDTTSLSSSIIKPVPNAQQQDIVNKPNKDKEDVLESSQQEHSENDKFADPIETVNAEIPPSDGHKNTTHQLEEIQEIADTIPTDLADPQTVEEEQQFHSTQNMDEEMKIKRDITLLEAMEKTAEPDDSVETPSTSPEPKAFGIQKLKSGSHVDKLLTRPVIIKRVESSSDSSLDISTTLSTPGAEAAPCSIIELEVTADTLSVTPENMTIELEASTEFPTKEEQSLVPCDITEMTEEDVDALFPKIRKSRRGRSLESGMAEKLSEENAIRDKEDEKQETKSHKGEEGRPPVPPETYLWEELKRWRLKGGYPWTHLDKPPFDEKTWKRFKEHEYEPINPPPLDSTVERPRQNDEDIEEKRRFLRIPRDEELVLSPEDMEVEAIAAAQGIQDDLEGRYLATTPMTTTTASRTDCDVNTSMLDSSGLEDLPLKRGSRTKKAIQSKTEQMRAQAQGIQQRLRSQAGKLRNKLRSIPRPSFPKKQDRERAKPQTSEQQQKSRFRLPERPKISLPERPKFNFPDRPKFKMPQKPKINLPNFTNPLKDRQAHSSPITEPRKNIFDVGFKTYPRIFSKKSKERGEYTTSSPKLPRSATPPPAPAQPPRKKVPVGQRWVNRFDDIKFVDDKESEVSHRSELSESLSEFHDKDFGIGEDLEPTQLPPPRTLSTKSSLSHLSERELASSRSSEDRLRKGVIEEIDSDQFFLRQKGISEEDIDMGKYLSEEIREAFKSPVVNALRQLDYGYDDEKIIANVRQQNDADKIENKENQDPLPPSRTRSLKKTQSLKKEPSPQPTPSPPREPIVKQEILNTRYQNLEQPVQRSQSVEETPKYRYENLQGSKPDRYENVEDEEDIGDHTSEYYKSPPPPVEYQHYKVPRSMPQPTPTKRKSSATDQGTNKKKQNGWVEVEVETSLEMVEVEEPPQPLQRKKSKKSIKSKQNSVDMEQKKDETIEPDYIIPDEAPELPPPEPPLRTRSLSRGARSIRSLHQEQEETIKPIPPKRTSSKSIHSLGLTGEPRTQRIEPETRSLHALAFEDESKSIEPPKRTKSLSRSRGSRSFHSLNAEEGEVATGNRPVPPDRNRSLSRGSRSFHSLADDENVAWKPQAPDRTRSLSRSSRTKSKTQPEEERIPVFERSHHYEAPMEYDYAVVDKGGNKPKPPRPPPPRRKKGSQSPNFNTFPRKSPLRPIRAYATLGPSRPPRKSKSKPKPAQSLEHIYQSDQISQAYTVIENTLRPAQIEDLHGSNKALQAEEVIEKMKGRPLPAPPRPPRLRAKTEEPISQSMEEVEEVCVSTQTDPLPDDLILEDDMMQELSHEEYKMQEAFLQAMREEDEQIQRQIEERRAKQLALQQQLLLEKAEAERQAKEIFEKEEAERLAKEELERQERLKAEETARASAAQETRERRLGQERRQPDEGEKKQLLQLEVEDDMGYASLDRRQLRVEEEPQASTSFQQPRALEEQTRQATVEQAPPQALAERSVPAPSQTPAPIYIPLVPEIINTENLRVSSLEVDRLTVNELQANSLHVQDVRTQNLQSHDLQGTSLHIQDIRSSSGQLTLGNIELPPDFLQQIIARIPWEELRPPPHTVPEQESGSQSLVRRQPVLEEETAPGQQSQVTAASTGRRRHRHLRQHSSRSQQSSDEEEGGRRARRHPRPAVAEPNIVDLSRQLAQACTNAGFRAVREFANQVRVPEADDRSQYVKTVICVLLVAIAGYILLVFSGNDIHHHHWDFQFPPQPPRQ